MGRIAGFLLEKGLFFLGGGGGAKDNRPLFLNSRTLFLLFFLLFFL